MTNESGSNDGVKVSDNFVGKRENADNPSFS